MLLTKRYNKNEDPSFASVKIINSNMNLCQGMINFIILEHGYYFSEIATIELPYLILSIFLKAYHHIVYSIFLKRFLHAAAALNKNT